jgi:alkylated DNA repair protein (DNA oxidative demethylase)
MTARPRGIAVRPGAVHYPGLLDAPAQLTLVAELRGAASAAPLFTPRMPRSGTPFSVRMTNCGSLGWVSDVAGYRYQALHPATGLPWPPIPAAALDVWHAVADRSEPPEACLVNFYAPGSRMGLHQDRDEETFDAPVVSISLGDTAVFRIGGTSRKDPTTSLKLASGDVFVFGGEARLAFHGIDRVLAGSSTLLDRGGRLNLTLRRVTAPLRNDPA